MIEVLKQSLEHGSFPQGSGIIHDLKKAIAELESQEPDVVRLSNGTFDVIGSRLVPLGALLYLHPLKRTWVDLTRTQIQNVYFEILKEHRGGHQMQGQLAFGEALQAKIKEKNT
jgi:hypothetical protein